jgi:hypothetical protein
MAGLSVLSLGVAYLSWRWVELPFRSRRLNFRKLLSLVGGATLVFAAFSITVGVFNGFRDRLNDVYTAEMREKETTLMTGITDYYLEPQTGHKPIILLLGDSYIRNWTGGLRGYLDTSRFDLAAMSFLNCRVRLDEERFRIFPGAARYQEHCAALERFFDDRTLKRRVAAVFLVSHRPFEYEENPFRFDLLRHLSSYVGDQVFIWGNYFQLDPKVAGSCINVMLIKKSGPGACLRYAVYPAANGETGDRSLYPFDLQFQYLDLFKLLRQPDGSYPASAQGVPFMFDWNHLTATFVNEIGRQVAEYRGDNPTYLAVRPYFRTIQTPALDTID